MNLESLEDRHTSTHWLGLFKAVLILSLFLPFFFFFFFFLWFIEDCFHTCLFSLRQVVAEIEKMADMVLSAVLRKVADIAGNLIVKEGSRMFKLKGDLDWIENEMTRIQCYLADVDAVAKQRGSRSVINLIREIWDLAYDVEDIIDKYFPKLSSSGRNDRKRCLGLLKSAKCIRDFAREIEEVKRRVEDIKQARQVYGIKERSSRDEGDPWDPRRIFPHIEDLNIVGFDEHIKELVAKVLDKDLRQPVVSIVGMAGLGKTTLAKKVYKSVQQRFQCSAWIYVSQQPNMKELLRDIARQVGLEAKKCEQDVEANLFEFLSKKRYVIVIDDIWHIEPWAALKNGIPSNFENGSRIIVTSRNRDVVVNMGAQVGRKSFVHELKPLDKENSANLFFKLITAATQNNDESNDFSQFANIGEKILERCGGVPLAIVVTAGLLLSRETTEHAWKGVLERMGHSDEDKYSEIFALSYTDLPAMLKPCFLYFGLFPEDHEISAFQLINLWAAEGFIRGTEMREVEDVGDDYLNHLIARNLIQVVGRRFNGNVRSCRIHDILHSLCIQVAKDINFFNTHNDVSTHNSTLRARRVTTHGSNIGKFISSNYQTPKLRAILCFGGDFEKLRRNWVKDGLGGFKFLHVLNVKFDGKFHNIPVEIGNLNYLSYLGLSRVGVELPYTICNLKSLSTLDLQWCHRVILPNVIWNMKQLRHILLPLYWTCSAPTFCGVNLDMFHPIDEISLPNLQTLRVRTYIFKVEWLHKLPNLRKLQLYCTNDRIIKVLSDATSVLQRLEELRLSLSTITFMDFITLNLSRYENLRNLHLSLWNNEWLPQHDNLPPNLTKLTLYYIQLQQDSIETLKRLPTLKTLKLVESSFPRNVMVCSGELGNFPQLEVLKIESGLKELIIEEGGMPKLKVLNIIGDSKVTTKVPDRIRNIMMITRSKVEDEDHGAFDLQSYLDAVI